MKNVTLIILVFLLLVVGGLVVLNKDRFKSPLQQEENKTTQTEITVPAPTTSQPVATTGASVDLGAEINNLDKTLDAVNPNDLDGSDLSNSSVGAN